jgi:peptidoglycan/xylan/chitin deacetylase (PgdA/CDA1 family)
MAGWLYQAALPVYRRLRRLKNAALNWVDPPVVVLLYHRVTIPISDPDQLAVSPENFRAQLTYLKDNFHLVRLEDDWSALPGPAVAITFDDGYADNALEALPVLEAVGAPATFFISSGHIGAKNEFWWCQMDRILLHDGDFLDSFSLADRQYGGEWPTGTPTQRQALYAHLNALAQTLDLDRLESWMGQLRTWSGQDEQGSGLNRSMNEEELKVLAGSPWTTIGAHTVSHAALSALSEEQQRYEIFTSKEALEKITGEKVPVFAYPFGNRKHYKRTSVALCRQAEFVKAASNFPGQVHRWTDPYQLPRQVVRNWDPDTFAIKMKEFWA